MSFSICMSCDSLFIYVTGLWLFFFFKQKTAYELRISDWSPDVCSSDLQTLVHLVCDTLRLVVVSSGTLDPHAVEEVMDNALKSHRHHTIKPADGLQSLADALPALGIVAAVLGVVKTMGSIDQPPEILGAMIGSETVGTFLGVLLA